MDSGLLYLAGSGILAAISLGYMHSQLNYTPQLESDMALVLASNLPLFPSVTLVLFNFVLSIISCIYLLLKFTFFGNASSTTGIERQQIVEKLFAFFSFKFVLIGLIVEPGIIDMIIWIYWCANLALAKAIIQHGLIQAEHLASENASPREFVRPACHILFIIIFSVYACRSYGAYISNASNPHAFWLLFLFDFVTLLIEMAHSTIVYTIYITSASSYKFFMDPVEMASVIHIIADIILLHATLLHFVYVCFINGLTLSLVDVLLFLNIRSTVLQILKRINELRALWATRASIDNVFPTCNVISDKHDVSDDNCPICLACLDRAKMLPCGHYIHANCLRQLMHRASFVSKSTLIYTTTNNNENRTENNGNDSVDHMNNQETSRGYQGFFTGMINNYHDYKATLGTHTYIHTYIHAHMYI